MPQKNWRQRICLSRLWLPSPNTVAWVASATDIYFSRFWKLEFWGQGASTVKYWWEPSCWLTDGCLLIPSSHGTEGSSGVFSSPYKGTDPVTATASSWPLNLLSSRRPRPLVSSLWELGLQHMNFGGTWSVHKRLKQILMRECSQWHYL